MSKNYHKWQERYLMNWCTIEQLEKLVTLKQLTNEELDLIMKSKDVDSERGE